MDTPEIIRLKEIILETMKGGEGSGYFGHFGRPGEVGGSSAEWARGVRAIRDLGGQVPQKAINEAEKILQHSGAIPSTRKAPKSFDEISKFYENHIPVKGDKWEGNNITVEVTKLKLTPDKRTSVELLIMDKKKSWYKTIDIDKDWSNEIPNIEKIVYR